MPDPVKPLYVRLPTPQSDALDAAALASGRSKQRLVRDAVQAHLESDGLTVGRISVSEAPPEILTLEEAASLLRVDPAELARAAAAGDVPARRIGDQWRFSRAAITTWLAG